ncbi:MAG: hypothetical protein KF729_05595 [Sandaracinaceae bacterium]|nr:hypothetical protein [Sandaracinaceae bacterium]
MRRAATLALGSFLAALVGVACGEDVIPSTEGLGAPVVEPPPPERERETLYDAEGRLRESDTVVAGLRLPRGLEPDRLLSKGRRHVYHSDVPPQKLVQYFGPRLLTLQIDHEGDRVRYVDAAPTGVRGGVVKLDVTIEPTSARPSLVEVFERPPPPVAGARTSEEEVRRHLDSLQPQRRE